MPESKTQTSWLNERYSNMMNNYISSLWGNISNSQKMEIYRKFYNAQVQEEKNEKEEEVSMELIQKWANSNNPTYKNMCNWQVNIHAIAKAIRDKTSQDPNFEYDFSDCDDNAIIDWYESNNPSLKSELDKVLCSESDLTTFLQKHWLEKRTVKSNNWSISEWTVLWVLWWWAAWLLWLGTAALWTNAAWNIWDWLYRQNINQSYRDAATLTTRKEAPRTLEEINKDIEATQKLLDESKNSNMSEALKKKQQEYYENQLERLNKNKIDAENDIKKYSPDKMPTSLETAYKYKIKWLTSTDIAAKAQSESKLLWNEIQWQLENSTQTVNLKDILDRVDVDEIARLEWDKAAVQAAVDMLKDEYKAAEYWKLSMLDANEIKSALYKKLPSWTRNDKDITNQYKKVLWEVASMLKEETQTKLWQEYWEDFAKKFIEWWNLHEIATNEISSLRGKWAVGGKIGALSTIWDMISTPISSEGWYYLKKANETIKSIPWKIKNAASDLLWYVKENPVSAIKEWVKWLTKEMPATVIMDEMIKNQEYIQDNPMAQKANAFNAVSESQWSKLANKSEVEELLKTPEFREAADNLGLDLQNLAKKFKINSKEVNATVDKQNKQKAEDNKNKLSLSAKIENENKKDKPQNSTINQLNKTASLKSQKTTVLTKKKSSK